MKSDCKKMKLQLFADAAAAAASSDSGEASAGSDAGDKAVTPSDSPAERQTFDSLIKGRYKKEFDQRVQAILRERFRANAADREKLAKMEPEMEALRRDNDRLKMAAQPSEETIRQSFARLTAQVEQAKSIYPGLDLRQELKEPMFTRLVINGVDAKTAYEVVHREEILRGGMQYAARQAARQVASAVQANAARPVENGLGAGAPAAMQLSDPRSLTRQMRKELRERVRRGEKIYW